MSWDSYIDNLVGHSKDSLGTNHVDKACIIGLDGAKWTTDDHAFALKLSADELSKIARTMKSGRMDEFMANGIHAEGIKYQFLREEDGKIAMAKRKDNGALTCQSTKTAVVIGHTAEGMQQGIGNKAVGVIADYLESLGM